MELCITLSITNRAYVDSVTKACLRIQFLAQWKANSVETMVICVKISCDINTVSTIFPRAHTCREYSQTKNNIIFISVVDVKWCVSLCFHLWMHFSLHSLVIVILLLFHFYFTACAKCALSTRPTTIFFAHV